MSKDNNYYEVKRSSGISAQDSELTELSGMAKKLNLSERRKKVSPGESSPSSSEEKEDTLPQRRYEGRKKGTRGSLSSEADISSLSTDGEVDLSSSSPTSFTSERFNAEGSKIKTSTPKEKVVRKLGGGDGGEGSDSVPLESRPESGFGGGDVAGEASVGTDWFGLAHPKFGTPVPNRIFIGGISCQTTENDLVRVFSKFGNVRGAKIIFDRGGVSKGYGFVTFETEQEATALCDSIMRKQFEPIILRDRRLNIAPAIKKQPGLSTDSGFSSDGSGLSSAGAGGFAAPGGLGYYYQNQYVAPAQPLAQTQYYDYGQHQEVPGRQAYFEHYARDGYTYATALVAPPQAIAYAAPAHYFAPPPQASPQMCYYDPAQQQYQAQVAASAQWNEWYAAGGGIQGGTNGLYYQQHQEHAYYEGVMAPTQPQIPVVAHQAQHYQQQWQQ